MLSTKAICLAASLMLAMAPATVCLAADPQLNFKIYSPQDPPAESPSGAADIPAPEASTDTTPGDTAAAPIKQAAPEASIFEDETAPKAEAPVSSKAKSTVTKAEEADLNTPLPETTTEPMAETPVVDTTPAPVETQTSTSSSSSSTQSSSAESNNNNSEAAPESSEATTITKVKSKEKESKLLQGYVRVVPVGTKIPIVMDTAVDSDTSQEGDEFSARTSEDLTIDGNTAVPAGSIIKGRIATLNAPRALNRSGSVALKFDNITTPDNRQIPLVATIVARGGVVHAKRGLRDVAIGAGTIALPIALGLAIGALAGKSNNTTNSTTTTTSTSSSKISKGSAAMIGAGVGLAIGVAVLLAKHGKKIEVRPGDELKIELAEDLRMPTM